MPNDFLYKAVVFYWTAYLYLRVSVDICVSNRYITVHPYVICNIYMYDEYHLQLYLKKPIVWKEILSHFFCIIIFFNVSFSISSLQMLNWGLIVFCTEWIIRSYQFPWHCRNNNEQVTLLFILFVFVSVFVSSFFANGVF